MKKYSLLLFILICCAFKREPYYKHIKAKDAAKYKCADEVYRGKDIQILRCFDAKGYERLIVQRQGKKGVEYFLLKLFAKFEPDSSIRWYEPPFIVSTESGNPKNGIWVYVRPYKEMKGNWLFSSGSSGYKFSVDSLPTGVDAANNPIATGIYFYQNNALVKISNEQSSAAFYGYNKEGFYFIAGDGMLYEKKYRLEDIH